MSPHNTDIVLDIQKSMMEQMLVNMSASIQCGRALTEEQRLYYMFGASLALTFHMRFSEVKECRPYVVKWWEEAQSFLDGKGSEHHKFFCAECAGVEESHARS